MALPLSGLRVIELSHYIAGPLCGQNLAEYGADVIKVEPPGGDFSRSGHPVRDGSSAYFALLNRGKTFRELDLKKDADREELYRLADGADAFLTNYAAGVPERLGIGHDTLRKRNPRLVYTHITGFGSAPGNPAVPAFDGAIQAMSGLAYVTGDPDGPPMKSGLFIADNLTGWVATTGTLAALVGAQRTGQGSYLDISMLDSMFSLLQFNVSLVRDFGEDPSRYGNRSTNVFCSTFPTLDGWCYIAPIPPSMWKSLSGAIGHPEFADPDSHVGTNSGRLANYDELERVVAEWTQTLTTAQLTEILTDLRIAHGPVLSPKQITESPLIAQRNMLTTANVDGVEFTVPANPVSFTRETAKEATN